LHNEGDLKKITDLTDEIRDRKIMERHLKKESNNNMAKEKNKLKNEVKKIEIQNMLISKQAYRWLKEKKLWQ